MNLKLATPADKAEIIDLLLNFHRDSNYQHFYIDWEKFETTIDLFIEDKENRVFLLGVKDERIVGLLAGQISESIFNYEKIASEIVWWVDKEYRSSRIGLELMNAFEYWAQRMGCRYVHMVHLETDSKDRMQKFYERRGYKASECTYLKEL